MAVLDFPIGPSINDRFPNPAIAGQPQYVWDGEKWTTVAAGVTSATPASATPLEDNATPQIGVTTKYAREDHVHPSTALKYSAQTLTSAQQSQSRTNIAAAPIDSLAYSGMQINGSMEVSQERGNATVGNFSSVKYLMDGWNASTIGVGVYNGGQNTATYPPGYSSSLQLWVVTANTSPAVGDLVTIQQPIEGYRISRLRWGSANASPITISFWVYANRAGTYSGAVTNGSRSYTFSFTVNVANSWEFKTVTIPGCTDGVWAKDNTVGMFVCFTMMAGTNRQTPAGAWVSGFYHGATGTINGVAATTDGMLITGVVVLPGIEAPSAERSPLIMRPFDQELATCRRYLQTADGNVYSGFSPSNIVGRIAVVFQTRMRGAPTITSPNPALLSLNSATQAGSANGINVLSFGLDGARIDVGFPTAGLVTGQGCVVTCPPGSLQFDARL